MAKEKSYPEWIEIEGERIPVRLTQTQIILQKAWEKREGWNRVTTIPEVRHQKELVARSRITVSGGRPEGRCLKTMGRAGWARKDVPEIVVDGPDAIDYPMSDGLREVFDEIRRLDQAWREGRARAETQKRRESARDKVKKTLAGWWEESCREDPSKNQDIRETLAGAYHTAHTRNLEDWDDAPHGSAWAREEEWKEYLARWGQGDFVP